MTRGLLGAVVALGLIGATPAAAGEFIAHHDGGGVAYRLSACERPPAPDVSVDTSLDGQERRAATNQSTHRFNAYVEAINAYFQCMVAEAQGDLRAHETAVTGYLDKEEKALFDKVEVLRQTLVREGR